MSRPAPQPRLAVRAAEPSFAGRPAAPSPSAPSRSRARRVLEADADRRTLIGALGLLSGSVSRADPPLVRRLLEHPVCAVRDEARRTHAVLSH